MSGGEIETETETEIEIEGTEEGTEEPVVGKKTKTHYITPSSTNHREREEQQ